MNSSAHARYCRIDQQERAGQGMHSNWEQINGIAIFWGREMATSAALRASRWQVAAANPTAVQDC